MKDDNQPKILSSEDSTLWRQAYLEAFVDTDCEHYRKYIAFPRQFSDGTHYEGYLWECLRSPSRITVQRFEDEVLRHAGVFVLGDDRSRDRTGGQLWPYPAYSVARFEPHLLLESLTSLPEDIYVFDSSVSWTLVLTHEDDGKRRICCAFGLDS